MDLGATICTPKAPLCALCPINAECLARKKGLQADLPRRAAKAARPERFGAAFLLFSDDGHVLLRRRPPKGPARRHAGDSLNALGQPRPGRPLRSTRP